ncbi:MAG: flavodoxin family protein [Planctomycetota bacterium]|nr:flavodoxin family protein [Planctomycetota bacterium]
MKTILGIVGSPRKNGNTHVLVSRVLEGAAEEGARTDLALLGDLAIGECDGCHACWRGKPCPKRDDMNSLFDRIAACDAIVFGTPVYWYGPTALMKAFIDRLVYFNCPENRPKIRGKSPAVVVPFEEEDPAAAALVTAFFEKCCRYLEMPLAATLLAPGVTGKGEVAGNESVMREAHDLGRTLARTLPPVGGTKA